MSDISSLSEAFETCKNMETIKKIISWLITQSTWIKALAIAIAAAILAVVLFSSCSTIQQAIPNMSKNEIGAEGIVSKEKNVSKTTRWFYKPEDEPSNLSSYESN